MKRVGHVFFVMILVVSLDTIGLTSHGSNTSEHDRYNSPPDEWIQIGVATKDDHQQNFLYGDFTSKSGVEIITCYSHSNTGIFHSYIDSGEWKMVPVHERFQPPLFVETFDEASLNWTFEPSMGPGAWSRDVNASNHGLGWAFTPNFTMFFDSCSYFPGVSGILVSPVFDVTSVYKPAARICWWNPNGTDYVAIYLSTDGGVTFPIQLSTLTNSVYADRWQWSNLDLSEYENETDLRFKFTCVSDGGAGGCATNPHIDDFSIVPRFNYTWPVKGIVGSDFDNDGREEFVTAMDKVFYPQNHANSSDSKPFPGAVYCDWSNESFANPQPLIWGAWGEQLCSPKFSCCVPVVTDPQFRNATNDKRDILIQTGFDETNTTSGARVFLLEQPEQGWRNLNYTYTSPNQTGVEPHNTPAFYVKTLWIHNGTADEELAWHSSEVANCSSAVINVGGICPVGRDLIVVGGYRNETRSNPLLEGRIVFYKRLNSIPNHAYRFEKILDLKIDKVWFRAVAQANLDGNNQNGKESFVIMYDAYDASNPLGSGGFICLEPDGNGSYIVTKIHIAEGRVYPYSGVYSYVVVTDWNRDGYDDLISYFVKKTVAHDYGDVVCFENRGSRVGFGASGDSRFSYAEGYYNVLWENDSFEWDLKLADADGDGKLELATGLTRRDPYWNAGNGTYKLFYRNILEEPPKYPVTGMAVHNGTLYALSNNNLMSHQLSGWTSIEAPAFLTSLASFQNSLVLGAAGGLYSCNGTGFNQVFTVSTYIKVLGTFSNVLYAATFLDKPPRLYYCSGSPENPSNWREDTAFSAILNFSGPFGSIDSLTVYDDELYVTSGGTVYSNNGTSWRTVKTYDDVYAYCDMIAYNGKLYLATRDQGWRKPMHQGYSGFSGRIVEYDGENWTTVLDHDYWIFALEVYKNEVYVGTADRIFSFNGTSWKTAFESDEGAYYAISLASFNGEIYVGMGNGYIFSDPAIKYGSIETPTVSELSLTNLLLGLMTVTCLVVVVRKTEPNRRHLHVASMMADNCLSTHLSNLSTRSTIQPPKK